ncbi:hypothetical protein CN154_29630 [Sinorhizobium meliloti]|uniref:hypothetical protein n=1 Tax=Rhizobium meliloti TaxID=382 RepID=UPI000FDB2D7B|nr:hypothetical protein [Sinorhizobium meliloti]RVK67033.1 hypothetical protein CN154_29630 [Sinorhizobium meliloti]
MLKYNLFMASISIVIYTLFNPVVGAASCFETEYVARIDYETSYDIVSPVSGFVAWPPKEGHSYDRIDLKQAFPNRPMRYMILQNQTSDVVAYVTNEALWARERLAETEESSAHESAVRGRAMWQWQSHMREHEDFLFAYQQGQNVPMRRKNEPPSDIRTRAYNFANNTTEFTWGADNGFNKKHSVESRLNYSDYMRAFELPQFQSNLSLGYKSSVLRTFAVEGERQLGMITCPELRARKSEGERRG